MDRKHQMSLLAGALEDYQGGLMPLGMLVDRVEGILNVFQDREIKDGFFNSLLALEEVHARVQIGDIEFETDGKPVVDRNIKEMLVKIEVFSVPPT